MNARTRFNTANDCGRPWLSACLLVLVALSSSGCINVFAIGGKVLFGDPKYPSSLEQQTGVELSGSDHKMAVVCDAPYSIRDQYGSLTTALMQEVTRLAKQNDIDVAPTRDVIDALEDSFDLAGPHAVAHSLDCDYILHIDLRTFSDYEDASRLYYRGRVAGTVYVYRVVGEPGGPGRRAVEVVRQPLRMEFPKSQSIPVEEQPRAVFQQEFRNVVAEEVGRHVYDIYTRDLY